VLRKVFLVFEIVRLSSDDDSSFVLTIPVILSRSSLLNSSGVVYRRHTPATFLSLLLLEESRESTHTGFQGLVGCGAMVRVVFSPSRHAASA
jgi:hypothetical protein